MTRPLTHPEIVSELQRLERVHGGGYEPAVFAPLRGKGVEIALPPSARTPKLSFQTIGRDERQRVVSKFAALMSCVHRQSYYPVCSGRERKGTLDSDRAGRWTAAAVRLMDYVVGGAL